MSLPIEEDPTPDIDWTCEKIAQYLKKGLNEAFVPARIRGLQRRKERHNEFVAQGLEEATTWFDDQIYLLENNSIEPAPKAVVSTRSYDTLNVPLHEYPLLKVYRTQDIYAQNKVIRTSPIVAAYCLSLPHQEELQGAMSWVSKTIAKLLLMPQQRFCTIVEGPPRAEYRTLLNEALIPVNAFLRFYFTVKD